MSEPGFASLGPTLLARKGGAKPAMRPQFAPLVAAEEEIAALADEQLEDLGWNDMGDEPAPVVAAADAREARRRVSARTFDQVAAQARRGTVEVHDLPAPLRVAAFLAEHPGAQRVLAGE